MATKPPDGNERLDAHLRGEFVKECVKKRLAARQAAAARNQPPWLNVLIGNHEMNRPS